MLGLESLVRFSGDIMSFNTKIRRKHACASVAVRALVHPPTRSRSPTLMSLLIGQLLLGPTGRCAQSVGSRQPSGSPAIAASPPLVPCLKPQGLQKVLPPRALEHIRRLRESPPRFQATAKQHFNFLLGIVLRSDHQFGGVQDWSRCTKSLTVY